MSIFSFFRKAQKGLGKTSKKGLEYRRFKLEGLEERTLLTAAPWSTGDDPSVTTMIVVTDAVPVVTEVDDPSVDVGAGVNVLTEAQPEDTVYVSVYVKSTDPQYGVSGGYCTLYFDNTGFTATDPLNGGYTVSPIMNTLTMLDASRIACSTDEYISGFGGMPTDIQAAYGYTQWALAGTQQFTVSADADGDYVFSNGMMRNSKGVEKESNNFIREDSVSPTYVMDVEFASTTLTVNSQPQPSDAPVVTAIAVSYDIPTATEIDEVTSLTEVKPGETVYVSVYVKSTDPLYGVSGGYCTLYFDNTGFVPTDPLNGGYTVSPIMETMTMIDTANCACSTDEYISKFGGFPADIKAAYGYTQWALAGTQQFTVSADAEGEYVFSNGVPRNKKGVEKTSDNFIREDSATTFSTDVEFASVTVTVEGVAPTPDIKDVVLTGYTGVYDAAAHSITVEDPEAATDTILYSVDGEVYDLTVNPAYTNVGTYTTYVKVSREGYNDFYGTAEVVITPADITGVTVSGIEKVYDGGFYSVAVEGLQDGDVVVYSLDGETYDLTELPAFSNVGTYTTYVKVSRENFNDWTGSADVVISEPQPADTPVVTAIAVSYDIPTATEIDEVTSLTEVNAGETVYVSVYVKSTDPLYGVSGGYCTLYFDNTGFTATDPLNGGYTVSPIMETMTMIDTANCACSTDEYISKFGGFPADIKAAYGYTQWALAGTQQFTVNADAEGEYVFSNGVPRNKKGVEKTSDNFIREDSATTFSTDVEFASVTVTVNNQPQPSDAPVVTAIAVSYDIPTATEIDEVTSLTEVKPGETVYVSVYVKSTDPLYGVSGGYCTLYFDNTGFVPTDPLNGGYTVSPIMETMTMIDTANCACSTDEYISKFGGFPADIKAAYGYTQWALAGTQQFTVSADAEGEYVFSNGVPRNKKGVEKTSDNFIREDSATTFSTDVEFASVTVTVEGVAPTPDIKDVVLTGYTGVYDAAAHSITVEDPEAATDTILYSVDGEVYDLTVNPAYTNVGTYTTYVKVSREGYNDFYGTAEVVITPADITGVTVSGIEKVYDGGFYSVAVEGLQDGDVVVYSLDGETYDLTELPAFSNVGTYTTYVKVSRENFNDFYGNADVVITPADITGVTVIGIEKVYDGGFYSVAVEGLQDGDAVVYSLDGETYDLTELPAFSNVGTYTTYVKVSRENFNDFYGNADVVITPADITGVTVIGIEKVYDGGFYSVAVEGLQDGDAVVYSLDGETYDLTELPAFSNVGTYTTYVKVSRENFNDFYGNADVVITPADITDVTIDSVNVDYDGNAYSITVNAQEGDIVLYSEDGGQTYSAENPAYTDAGVNFVYVKVSRENYNDWTGSGYVIINAATIEDVTLEGWEGAYDGEAHSITVTDPQADTDEIFYSLDGYTFDLTENPAFTEAGTYNVWVKVRRANYNDWVGNAAVTIIGDEPVITDVSVSGYTGQYDGVAHSITVVDPQADTDTILYSLDGVTYDLTVNPAFTNAYSWNTVYVKVSREGYQDWYGQAVVNIWTKTLTVDGTTASDKVYDGTTDADVAMGTVIGIVDGDDVTVTIASAEFDSAEAGVRDVTVYYNIEGEDAANYSIEPTVIEGVHIYDTSAADGYTVDAAGFAGLAAGDHVVIDGVSYQIGQVLGTDVSADDVFNAYTNGFAALKNLAAYSGLYDYQDGNSVTIDIVSIAPGVDDTAEGITLWRSDVNGEFTQVWTGTVVGYNFGGTAFVQAITVVGNTTWDNQAVIYVGDALNINYNNAYDENVLTGFFVDGDALDAQIAPTGAENSAVNINSAGKNIKLAMANFYGDQVYTGDFNVVANKADFTDFQYGDAAMDGTAFTRVGFLNLGSDTDLRQLFIQIGDTQEGLTKDTEAAVRLAEGGQIDELMVQIDAFFTNGFKNNLYVDNSGAIDAFNFETSSSVYKMLQAYWPAVMGTAPVPTEQELYYYYYDGETAASNPFNTGSDENITAFLTALQSGDARQQALAAEMIVRMKGMHDVADVTTLTAVNNESGVIGEGLDKLWGFGGGVSFENYGTISCDIDSTDGQGADYFLNDGGTMGGFASGSTDDIFTTGGGAVNGDVNVGAGNDVVTVFDTTAFGGEITFGDGDDTLVLYGSALGDAGTVFSAGLADVPEQIVIYDIARDDAAESTVTIDTAIPDTDVVVDFSLVDAEKYGEYGVAIGANGDLTAIAAYSVKLDADTVLGNGSGKVVIFSGATANNFNLDAEFAFQAGESSATLVIDGTDKLVIGNYEYSLLYDGTNVYLQRTGAEEKADLVTVSVTAVDKYTGDVLDIDGGELDPSNVANVTVTFQNIGGAAVADAYFYSAVRLKNADTGEYITLNPGKDWYERYCKGGEDVGETGSFSFLLPRLAVGNYTIEIQLNSRGTVDEANYDDDYSEISFSVGAHGSDLAVTVASFSAVDEYTGEVLDIYGGGIENTNNARVTVTFWNIGEEDVDVTWPSGNTYFYNEVRVYDEAGNYYVMDASGRWYERIVTPGYVAANGGEASFDFLMPQLEAGKYYIDVVLDHRLVTDDVDRSNNVITFEFEVTEHVATYALELADAVATGRTSGDAVELVDGAEIESEVSDVVVSFKNVSGSDIDAPYIYGGVKLQDSEGNYILGSADSWYERLTYEGRGKDETGTFKFTMKALEAGDYTLTLAIDQRAAIGDVGDFRTINFTVKGGEVSKADLANTGISAVDKISGAELNLNAVLPTQIPVFTVNYANLGAAITAPYFYSSVQVVKSDGTVVLDTYERLCKTGLGAGEAGSFSFTIGKQAVGSYTVKVQLDNREVIDQVTRDNDYIEYDFEVINLEGAALPEAFADEAFVDDLFVDF